MSRDPAAEERLDFLAHEVGQTAGAGPLGLELQVWLGHSSIVTTQRYVHLAPGGGRELIGALNTAAVRAKPGTNGSGD